MRYLLDTHIYLWWLNADNRLQPHTKNLLSDSAQFVYISVVNAWEISLKLKTNSEFKLKTSFEKCFVNLEFEMLEISLSHILELHKLPFYHKDPFDRLLIAQAKSENLKLITIDKKIKKYKLPLIEN